MIGIAWEFEAVPGDKNPHPLKLLRNRQVAASVRDTRSTHDSVYLHGGVSHHLRLQALQQVASFAVLVSDVDHPIRCSDNVVGLVVSTAWGR